ARAQRSTPRPIPRTGAPRPSSILNIGIHFNVPASAETRSREPTAGERLGFAGKSQGSSCVIGPAWLSARVASELLVGAGYPGRQSLRSFSLGYFLLAPTGRQMEPADDQRKPRTHQGLRNRRYEQPRSSTMSRRPGAVPATGR